MSHIYLLSMSTTLVLTGLIWTIQCVHYPSFVYVDPSQFHSFSMFHQRVITWVVAPLMIFELITAILLVVQIPGDTKLITLLVPVLLVWLSTFFLSVPLHNQLLKEGFSQELIKQLVLTNWPRTLLWTGRSVLMLFWMRLYV